MPTNPPNELPTESISPRQRRWRKAAVLLGVLLLLGAAIMWLSGYGSPEKLPDGTAQVTWGGILQLSLLFGGCAMIFLADSPWTLFQIVVMIGGGILGGVAAEEVSPQESGAGGAGFALGMALGAGVAFIATWALSWLFDAARNLMVNRRDSSHGGG